MLYGRFRFIIKFTDQAYLPPYKGSTLRGAFGTALKQIVCALKRQECHHCVLGSRCVYTMFFENKRASHNKSEKGPSLPHPFMIEPPLESKTCFGPEEELSFHLILFGPALKYLPYCIYAFHQMGQIGVGKRINGKRAGFVLKEVSFYQSSSVASIYSQEDQILKGGDFFQNLTLDDKPCSDLNYLTIYLKTPLRVKYGNQLRDELPFHILIRAALRRISTLFTHYGDGEPDLDYKGLVERAKAVKVIDSDLRWLDWHRYSNRQETKMSLGGIVGWVRYEGNLGEFWPFLHLGEKLHLGKQTTFGLGQIQMNL